MHLVALWSVLNAGTAFALNAGTVYQKRVLYRQEQVSYEASKLSHAFSMMHLVWTIQAHKCV